MNNINYTKLGAIGAEAAHDEQAKIGRNIFHVCISDKSDAWTREESSRAAYAEAVVKAYLEQVGEGFPAVGDCLQALPTSPTTGQAIEAIRSLMLASFAKKMGAVAKLPEKWRSVVTGTGFQSVYATCAINLEDALSLPTVEVEPAEKWAQEKAAHAQGKRIERRNKNFDGYWTVWMGVSRPIWENDPSIEYRIAPDQPAQPGKLTDAELGEIAQNAVKAENPHSLITGWSVTKGTALLTWTRAVREAVEKQQGEEIARLTAKIEACDQARKNACDDRDVARAEFAALQARYREMTGVLQECVQKHNLVGSGKIDRLVVEAVNRLTAELATVTAERDRLQPRPISTAPTEADANNDGRVLLLGDGNSANFATIANWDGVHSSWRRWLPLNPAAYVSPAKAKKAGKAGKALEYSYKMMSEKKVLEAIEQLEATKQLLKGMLKP
jgi:hypothetical protein